MSRSNSALAIQEGAVQRSILSNLHALQQELGLLRRPGVGLYYWRQNNGRAFDPRTKAVVTFGVPGLPDILGVVNGRFFAIECKRPKGGVFSDVQIAVRLMIEASGGLYLVGDDVIATIATIRAAAGL